MRGKLKRFPEVTLKDIDLKRGIATMEAAPAFDQYVALEHAIEEAGGAIKMFHPRYLVPQAHYASLGVRGRDFDKTEKLRESLEKVEGVRSVIIDDERWFTNEKGLEVGGAVIFADRNPRLNRRLVETAKRAGFILEPKDHGEGAQDAEEWSEMNHAFAGVCLLFLSTFGILQLGLKYPPPLVRYGTVFIWFALFVFLFIRADRGAWPLGPMSWWESFRNWETLQHRVGTGIVLLIAVGDFMRIRKGWSMNPVLSRWGMLVVGVGGSAMLYTHLHTTLDPAHYAMVARMNAQHLAIATCSLFFTLSKFAWDQWQVPRKGGKFLWLIFLMILGVILTLYVE